MDNKQIEEMARIIAFDLCDYGKQHSYVYGDKAKCYSSENFSECIKIKNVVDKLYEQGYRKVPKGSVVLSKEEYESVQKLFTYDKPMLDRIDNFSKEIKDQARKQAVKELIEKAENKPLYICDEYDDDNVEKVIPLESLKEIAKEFGVEL